MIEYWAGEEPAQLHRVGILWWSEADGRLIARGGFDMAEGSAVTLTVVSDSLSGERRFDGSVHPDQVDELLDAPEGYPLRIEENCGQAGETWAVAGPVPPEFSSIPPGWRIEEKWVHGHPSSYYVVKAI